MKMWSPFKLWSCSILVAGFVLNLNYGLTQTLPGEFLPDSEVDEGGCIMPPTINPLPVVKLFVSI